MPSGPRYDNAAKALCTHVPRLLCAWLGVPLEAGVTVTRLSEMASKPATRQVDAILAVGDWLVIHIEFQAYGETFLGWRMIDYRSLLVRRPELRHKQIVQHVVVLGSDRVDEGVHDEQVDYTYPVHYLRDHPVEEFLTDPGLAPFAVLARLADRDRVGVLRQALDLIASVADDQLRLVLAQAAVDLAGVRLAPDIINATWEESAMPIPSLLNQTYEDGRTAGREEGREEGREGLLAEMLRHRFGPDGRIPGVARRLAAVPPADALGRIEQASSLDELA